MAQSSRNERMGFVNINPAQMEPLGGQTQAEVRDRVWLQTERTRRTIRSEAGSKSGGNVDLTPVTAAFVGTPVSGASPLTVQFTATITGPATIYDWDFGDGTAHSAAQNPSHIYASAGTRTVILTVKSDKQADVVVTRTNYITAS